MIQSVTTWVTAFTLGTRAARHPAKGARRKPCIGNSLVKHNYGRGGIRTLGTLSRTHTFQACALNHSATRPRDWCAGPYAGDLTDPCDDAPEVGSGASP